MGAAMDAICDDLGRPAWKLHGLRMLDPSIFQHLPFASADSTNTAVNGGRISRFGMYAPPTAGQRANVIADRIEAHTSSPIWLRERQPSSLCNPFPAYLDACRCTAGGRFLCPKKTRFTSKTRP